MKISDDAIEYLVEIICGGQETPYRSGPQLVEFFNRFGAEDLYHSGFPSRSAYVRDKIKEFNGLDELSKIVEAAFDYNPSDELKAQDLAFQFNRIVARDGCKLVKEYYPGFYAGDRYHEGPLYFVLKPNTTRLPEAPEYLLRDDNLSEHVSKARTRIGVADYSGAISICYTLLEEYLKLSLREEKVEFKESEGDIKKLYQILAKKRDLRPDDLTPEPLKPLMGGLSTLVSGFYEIANKSSDRHAAKYRPSRHHAAFVVPLTFAFCEFLVASSIYREGRADPR